MSTDPNAGLVDLHLAQSYQSRILAKQDDNAAIATFAKGMRASADLMRCAEERLNGLTDAVTRKCFISKFHKETLLAALAKARGES